MLPLVRAAHVCRKLYSQTYRVNIRLLNAGEKWASRCAFSRPFLIFRAQRYKKIMNCNRQTVKEGGRDDEIKPRLSLRLLWENVFA